MPATEQIDALEAELASRLTREDSKRNRERKRSRNAFLAQSILVLIATICLGVSWPEQGETLKNVALGANAAATFAATIAGYFNFRDRWIHHVRTVAGLHGIKGDLALLRQRIEASEPVIPEVEELRARMRTLLGESMANWAAIAAAAPPTTPTQRPGGQ